ncbi:MAG: hypothetical protein DRP78_04000 [Candidatus Omnitrophota bacterium]|nr:MAG: hypothetical protein DRP78_04000 [Candidatus Omnitrophota bacterium]
MKKIDAEIISFLEKQGFVIVSTMDEQKRIHCSAKGISIIKPEGEIYLVDLYLRNTFNNLTKNSIISVNAFDEYVFAGYTLQGKAEVIKKKLMPEDVIEYWENKVIKMISSRVIKNMKEEKIARHLDVHFSEPEYVIKMQVEEIIDLKPGDLKIESR